VRIAAATAAELAPWNGRWPHTMSLAQRVGNLNGARQNPIEIER
jgi:hypothetical protein